MEVDLKKLKESGLFVEEYIFLALINEEKDITNFKWFGTYPDNVTPIYSKELISNLYIIPTEEGYILREKGRKLFEDSKDLYTFDQFWDEYHRITKLLKSDKEATLKYWKRLKAKEKVLAYENIENYYNSCVARKDPRSGKVYIKKARTYLDDKNFNDEFKTGNSSEGGKSIFSITGENK